MAGRWLGDWGWAEPERRSLRDKALDALVRLADLRRALAARAERAARPGAGHHGGGRAAHP
jgi:hypothetical protein